LIGVPKTSVFGTGGVRKTQVFGTRPHSLP
jgi:hypothetical protein